MKYHAFYWSKDGTHFLNCLKCGIEFGDDINMVCPGLPKVKPTPKKKKVGRPKKMIKQLAQDYVKSQEVTFKITRLEDGTEFIMVPLSEWDYWVTTDIPKFTLYKKVKK